MLINFIYIKNYIWSYYLNWIQNLKELIYVDLNY